MLMSKLINVSDSVYNALTLQKRAKNASYSEVITALIAANKPPNKSRDMHEMVAWAKERAAKYRGKLEKTDHDLIVYGVSRDGA